MKRLIALLVILFLPCLAWGQGMQPVGGITVSGGAPSGQTFSEPFTYSNGELATVSSGVWVKLTGADSSVASNLLALGDSTVYLYATPTDTVSQYVAIWMSDAESTYSGIYARQIATDNATTKAYALRHNVADELVVRYCTGTSCTTIGNAMDPGYIGANDSFGLEVTGTGASTKWKIFYWDNAAVPARGSWGTCNYGKYITGQTATTCTANEAVADLGANYADTGKYVGVYSGGISSGNQNYDNWVAGDIQ